MILRTVITFSTAQLLFSHVKNNSIWVDNGLKGQRIHVTYIFIVNILHIFIKKNKIEKKFLYYLM